MEDFNLEFKRLLEQKKLVIGAERTMKLLKAGNIQRIFLASNAPEQITQTVAHYKKIVELDVVELKIPNRELGTLCKRPFPISVIGVQRD